MVFTVPRAPPGGRWLWEMWALGSRLTGEGGVLLGPPQQGTGCAPEWMR